MNRVPAFIPTDEKPRFSIHVIQLTLVAKVLLFVATVIFI